MRTSLKKSCSHLTTKPADGRNAGFTLVEMLVTLCIVALLGGSIAGSLSLLGRMRNITRAGTAQQELDVTAAYLQDLLEHSRNLPLIRPGQDKLSFIGDQHRLNFVAQARTASNRRVLREVILTLRQQENGLAIVEQQTARRQSNGAEEASFVVLEQVKQFNLGYLQRQASGAPLWQDSWRSPNRPDAVSIRIEAVRGGQSFSAIRTVVFEH